MKTGIYKHYKEKSYLVLGTVRHSETQEILVLYIPLYPIPDNNGTQMAVRPIEMFNGEVEPGIKRFTYIEG